MTRTLPLIVVCGLGNQGSHKDQGTLTYRAAAGKHGVSQSFVWKLWNQDPS